jgi:DNA repair protein RadD
MRDRPSNGVLPGRTCAHGWRGGGGHERAPPLVSSPSTRARAPAGLRGGRETSGGRPQAPTGFGKTLLAAQIAQSALDKGKRVAFVVPKLNLIDQTVDAFAAEGIRAVGVMQGHHPLTDAEQPVQVISAQTLARRERPQVDLVIIDECHELHKAILQWITDSDWAAIPFIGLSATPWTAGWGAISTTSSSQRPRLT